MLCQSGFLPEPSAKLVNNSVLRAFYDKKLAILPEKRVERAKFEGESDKVEIRKVQFFSVTSEKCRTKQKIFRLILKKSERTIIFYGCFRNLRK